MMTPNGFSFLWLSLTEGAIQEELRNILQRRGGKGPAGEDDLFLALPSAACTNSC